MDVFKIKTEAFEGPLDLLLSLIEKRKLFINDISLAKVTDDFILYIKEFEHFPMEQSAQFILIASTLLLIKSKSLLPTLTLTEEEQASVEDLESRLKIYQRMKELSEHIKTRFGANILHAKSITRQATVVFTPDKDTNLVSLLHALRGALINLPKKEFVPEVVVKQVISIEEMIDKLTDRISSSLRMSFKDFAGVGREEKVNVIVGFLAMLELVKNGIINATQHDDHGDIHMETTEISVPRYN